MLRNFIEEFKLRIHKVDNPEPPKPRYEEPSADLPIKRFNIHKRSLPIGIDNIVVVGVTKNEAEWWVEKILKTKCYQNDPDSTKTIVYFDIIPVGAKPKEKSIFFNARPISL
jgi:hypothetical protein